MGYRVRTWVWTHSPPSLAHLPWCLLTDSPFSSRMGLCESLPRGEASVGGPLSGTHTEMGDREEREVE